jgi:hypothetical protein
MHHVIQNDLYNEQGFNALMDTLTELGAPFTVVKVIPFVHELEPDINLEGEVMVWGATTLGHISRLKGWTPGVFKTDEFDMRVLHSQYGEHMLNSDAVFCTFGELAFEGVKFVRPVHDSKTFTGALVHSEEMAAWIEKVRAAENDGFTSLDSDTPVMYASPKHIQLEARYFVVGGRVITGSTYRVHGRSQKHNLDNNPNLRDLQKFAQSMVDRWSPDRAFVIDAAITGDDEYKVVEINALNNAGFYACNMGAVVRAIECL